MQLAPAPVGARPHVFVNLLMFFSVSAAVIMTPGQDTALTIRNTLLGGRKAGLGTAAGVAAGQGLWTLATSLGLAALLLASPIAFRGVRIAGAFYLMWLGGQALAGALRGGARAGTFAGVTARLSSATAFRQGVLSNLGNPKMAVFFTGLLPQFVATPTFASLAGLGFAFATMTLIWLVLYAFVIARAGDVLRTPGVWRALEGVTGAALVALGVWVVIEGFAGKAG